MEKQRTAATLDEVCLAILRSHTQLAQLLDELEVHAKAVLDDRADASALDATIELVRARFMRSIELEEKLLLPRLPSRARARRCALSDHADQRARVEGLARDRVVFADASTVAREALVLVHAARKSVADEDSWLRQLR